MSERQKSNQRVSHEAKKVTKSDIRHDVNSLS